MKIAILTYGEYRTADFAVPTWNVLNTANDVDVYVHTQTKSDNRDISENDIKKLFKNCKIWLESNDAFEYDTEPKDIHMNFRSYRFLYKKLIESDKKYDFIIVNRIDSFLYIHDIDSFFNNYDKTAIYTLKSDITYDNPFIQDHFFMGSFDVISSFLKNLPKPKNLIDSHVDFGRYIISTKLKNILNGNIFSFHLRPNMLEFVNEFINSTDCNRIELLNSWVRNDGTHRILESNWKNNVK